MDINLNYISGSCSGILAYSSSDNTWIVGDDAGQVQSCEMNSAPTVLMGNSIETLTMNLKGDLIAVSSDTDLVGVYGYPLNAKKDFLYRSTLKINYMEFTQNGQHL